MAVVGELQVRVTAVIQSCVLRVCVMCHSDLWNKWGCLPTSSAFSIYNGLCRTTTKLHHTAHAYAGGQCRTTSCSQEHYTDILANVTLFWRLGGNNADADIRSELVSDDDVNSVVNNTISYILWNPKVPYRIYENPLLKCILSQMNPLSTHPFKIWFDILPFLLDR